MTPSGLRGQAAAIAAACLLVGACAHAPVAEPVPMVAEPPPAGPLVLRPLQTDLPRAGQWRNGFDLADLDGDGYLDLLHPPARKRAAGPVVFLGDGTGRFTRWEAAAFPERPLDYGAAVAADFDRDGRADAAIAVHLHGLAVLHQVADGVFEDRSAGLPWDGAGFSARSLAAADWDGDGRTDLVAFGEGPTRSGAAGGGALGLAVFLNRGDRWERAQLAPGAGYGDSLAVADVNGDGRPDAVTAASGAAGRSLLHLGTGDGARIVEVPGLPAGAIVGAVAAADVDRDGRAEAVVASLVPQPGAWSSALHLLDWRDGIPRITELARTTGRLLVRAAVLGDVDGDGGAEAVLLADDGSLHVVPLARPEDRLVLPAPDWRAGCSGYGLRLADLTGDGRPEIVASFAGEGSPFQLGPGCPSGGGFEAWTTAAAP